MDKDYSPLQRARLKYAPKFPKVLSAGIGNFHTVAGETMEPVTDRDALKKIFPHTYGLPEIKIEKGGGTSAAPGKMTIGVILSGGPAPGGHNVIAGIFDAMKHAHPESTLVGFKGGPGGLVDDKSVIIDAALVDQFRNTGGFDIIGSGRTKIESPQQCAKALEVARKHGLNALVVIGGDDSNTNAALLAEYFAANKAGISVVGVPKTIDGDLKNQAIETSFGFDTATKTYSELIGNICRDAASSRKYWHFIRLMGRSASHIALECALQTRPNVCFISEEVETRKIGLGAIVGEIVASVIAHSEKNESFGVVLIPEGLIEFIPEMRALIASINDFLATSEEQFKACASFEDQRAMIVAALATAPVTTQVTSTSGLFRSLPETIQRQLLWDRDPHGNVQVSRIETEKLLVEMVQTRLAALAQEGKFKGKFDFQTHFMGYEGRCGFPSNFDADYCYSLGYTAFVLANARASGYISSVRELMHNAEDWKAGGIPLVSMMNIERRHGEDKPVIKKALVDLEGKPFMEFDAARKDWAKSSNYRIPGGIQYFGPPEITDSSTITLMLEQSS